MRSSSSIRIVALRLALLAVAGLGAPCLTASAQPAPAKADSASAAAAQACERAARQALAGTGSRAAALTFNPGPAVQVGLSNDSQIVLRGVARLQDAKEVRSFSYSCNVDPASADVTGLVTRDTTPAAAQAPTPAPVEPDLSRLSPEACESNAVEMLKQRWPRVSEISFDVATRVFRQQSGSQAELHGSGRAVPSQGSPSTFFAFDCAVDPRNGRVQGTRLSW